MTERIPVYKRKVFFKGKERKGACVSLCHSPGGHYCCHASEQTGDLGAGQDSASTSRWNLSNPQILLSLSPFYLSKDMQTKLIIWKIDRHFGLLAKKHDWVAFLSFFLSFLIYMGELPQATKTLPFSLFSKCVFLVAMWAHIEIWVFTFQNIVLGKEERERVKGTIENEVYLIEK